MAFSDFRERDYSVIRHVPATDDFNESYFVRLSQEALIGSGGFNLGDVRGFEGLEGRFKIKAAYEDSVFWLEKVTNLELSLDGFPLEDFRENLPTFLDINRNDYLLDNQGNVIAFFYPRREGGEEVKIPVGALVTGTSLPGTSSSYVFEVTGSSFDSVTSEQSMVTYYVREVAYPFIKPNSTEVEYGD